MQFRCASAYYDKAASSTRNYLILNTSDQSTVRLMPKNDQLVLSLEKLGQKSKMGNLTQVQSLLYEVVQADTTGDDRLTESDQKAIALSDVSGKNYTELVTNVDRVLGKIQTTPTRMILIYQSEKKNLLAEIDITTRKVVATKSLPAID